MRTLRKLMATVSATPIQKGDAELRSLTIDSREVQPGTLFMARTGAQHDGHDYIDAAIQSGASAIVLTDPTRAPQNASIPIYAVQAADPAFGLLAAAFYDHPTSKLDVYGVTGTNGKSSTVWMLDHLLRKTGRRVALISTIGYRIGEQWTSAPNTTPDALVIQKMADQAVRDGCDALVMEVSSHGIITGRIAGTQFRVGGFTNISRDHLDFHKTEEAYLRAKALFFSLFLPNDHKAVDAVFAAGERLDDVLDLVQTGPVYDEQSDYLACLETPHVKAIHSTIVAFDEDAKADVVVTAALQKDAHYYEIDVRDGTTSAQGTLPLVGDFQVKNAGLAMTMIQRATGMPWSQLVHALQDCPPVPGRLQLVAHPHDDEPAIYVDYAHTPDALENVLTTMRHTTSSKLSVVVGCGGDRDRGKRPLMAAVAARLSDVAMLTTDNPRTEDPDAILQEMLGGIEGEAGVEHITDRRQAISHIVGSQHGGTCIIAGKGHENYQEIGRERWYWNDVEEARMAVAQRRFGMTNTSILSGWSTDRLADILDGSWHQLTEAIVWGSLSTDTRTLQPGALFVALSGEHFDAHDHLQRACDAGAACVVVERLVPDVAVPQLLVPSTHAALGVLTRAIVDQARRAEKGLQIIGITGSNGKTTTRTFAAALAELLDGHPPLPTKGNFNNQIGLPLSVAPLGPTQHRAILEMGANHHGDIRELVHMAPPDVAVLTSIAPSHLEGFGSLDGIRQAKSEMVRDAHPKWVIMPHDELGGIWERAAQEKGAQILTFGPKDASLLCRRDSANAPVILRGNTVWPGFYAEVQVPVAGVHNAGNFAAAVLATAVTPSGELRQPPTDVLERFAQTLQAPPGRLEQYTVCERDVIYDAYNANPASMKAALNVLAEAPSPRIAVLGELFELGENTHALHQEVRAYATTCAETVVCIGPRWGNAGKDGVIVAANREEAVEIIAPRAKSGVTILWKGSRGARLELVRDAVEQRWRGGKL